MQDRVGLHLPIKPNGNDSRVVAWQVQADEAGLPVLICHVALELGVPMRETRHTTALVRHEVNHAIIPAPDAGVPCSTQRGGPDSQTRSLRRSG